MSYKSVYTLAEIRYLWKSRGNKNYEMKRLNATGNFIQSITFEDVRNRREVSGKLVTSPREGEAYHWPRLQHENLAPLLDIVSINENVSIYITTVSRRSLNYVIHENGFLGAPNCFDRKKSYAEDVLWGLDYLHDKHLSLMNLSDENIYINESDKAVITDFSHLMLSERATKKCVSVSALYRAPELDMDITHSSENFDAIKAEIWACGILMLQIFTGNIVPTTFASDDGKLLEFIENMQHDVLIQANIGASIAPHILIDFKQFLDLFLHVNPSSRTTAKTAAINLFLQRNPKEHDKHFKIRSELLSPVSEEISKQLSLIDNVSNSSKSCLEKKKIITKMSDDISVFTSVNDSVTNKEKIKRRWPFSKIINLPHVASRTPEKVNWFADSSCSKKSKWNGQSTKKELIAHDIEGGQNLKQVIGDSVEMTFLKAEQTQNLCYKSSKFSPETGTCVIKEDIDLEPFTNTSLEHNNLKKTENSAEAAFHIDNSLSDPSGGTSKDTITCNKYQTFFFTQNLHENISHNFIEMEKEAKNKTMTMINAKTRTLPPNDFQRNSIVNTMRYNRNSNDYSLKLSHIFSSRSYPCLCPNPVRSSMGCNTTTRRSTSSDDIQLIYSAEVSVPKPLAFNADDNAEQVHNLSDAISVWNSLYYPNSETAEEGDKKCLSWMKIFKDNNSVPFMSVPLENKIPELYSHDSMKVLHGDKERGANSETQEVKNKSKTELYSSDKIKHIADGRSNNNCLNDFNACNHNIVDRRIADIILMKSEMPSCSSNTIPEEINSQENISIQNSHTNMNVNDIDYLRNLKSDNPLSKAIFTENNPPRVTCGKEHTAKSFLASDISKGLDLADNDTTNKSIDHVDFCDQKSIERQQMDFLNPFLNECEWNVESRQTNDIELSNLNSTEKGFKLDDDTSSNKVSVFHDQIGAFERNVNSFTEIRLSPKHCDDIVGYLIKKEKKCRKKSWFRHLCPGCKVYREDK